MTGLGDIESVRWAVLLVAAAAAAAIDWRSRRIPNAVTGPLILAGLALGLVGSGLSGLGDAALGVAVVSAPFVVLWLLAGSGAGDAKMMMGVGACLGVWPGVPAMLVIAVVGGVASAASLWRSGGLGLAGRNVALMGVAAVHAARGGGPMDVPLQREQKIPYGVSIFAGLLLTAGLRLGGVV